MNHFEYIESTAGHVPVCPLKSIFASWGSTPHLIGLHDFVTPAVHPMHTVRHLDRIIRFLQGSQSWPTDTKTTLLTPRVALSRTCMICVRYGLIGLDCNPYRCRSFARIYPILNFWANPLGTRDDAKEQYCTELMQPLPNYWISSRNKLSPIANKYRDLIVPNRIVFSCVEWWPITSTQLLWTATVRPRATECSRWGWREREWQRADWRNFTGQLFNAGSICRYARCMPAFADNKDLPSTELLMLHATVWFDWQASFRIFIHSCYTGKQHSTNSTQESLTLISRRTRLCTVRLRPTSK